MSKMIKAREEENPEESWNIYKSAYEVNFKISEKFQLSCVCVSAQKN